MTELSPEALNSLSREELIALIVQLFAEVRQLRAEVERLKKPPTTSQNSSQPPSRDQKSNRPSGRRRRRRGAKLGHAKSERPLSDHPNTVIEARVTLCADCGADLKAVPPHAVVRRQVTELPLIEPMVIETRQHQVVCPQCHHVQQGPLPEGLEATRHFGPRLEATVTYLQHQQHMSYERTQDTLLDLFSVTVSEGGQACILARAGQAAAVEATAIRQDVIQSPVVGSDETGARVDGQTWWQWVFASPTAIYHVIRASRGKDVIPEIFDDQRVATWVCDCWSPQLKAPADCFQLCLAHQIRNLQGLRDRCPHLSWASEMQALFRTAIHLAKRRDQLTASGFQRRVKALEGQLEQLLHRRVVTKAAQPLLKRYRKHREHLLVFLHDPQVPWHNNACERALRPSVIHRKVTGGFRSQWGAEAYAALASVADTAKLHGQSVFETLVRLMGRPVLPYLSVKNP
jgi:transposase